MYLKLKYYLAAAKNRSYFGRFFLRRRHTYARTAPDLFFTKTREVEHTRRNTARSPASDLTGHKVAYGQLCARRNRRAFWKTLEVRFFSGDDLFCFLRIKLVSFNRLFGAKLRRVRKGSVVSRYVLCSRGGAGARGGLVFVCF